jgi:hypothetical protein
MPISLQDQIHRQQKYDARKRTEATLESELAECLGRLESLAAELDWSGRQIAERLGLSETTWRRLKAGQLDLAVWLPKLRAAVARLNSSRPAPASQMTTYE